MQLRNGVLVQVDGEIDAVDHRPERSRQWLHVECAGPGRRTPHRQTRLRPGDEAAGQIGSIEEAEVLQGRRRQARSIALGAHEDDLLIVSGHLGKPVRTARIEPPLENVAIDDQRARQLTVPTPHLDGSDVDQQRARRLRRRCRRRVGPHETSTGRGEDLRDRLCHGDSLFDTISTWVASRSVPACWA